MSKKKSCFVIMPISDSIDYPEGHFSRVYQHLIKPACEQANYEPLRADDVKKTNYIAIDVIRRIIESDMVICDLSSQNPNVLYELGIRQAFDKPVVLIKDSKTKRIFDIQGFRDFEYDGTLRVDSVQKEIKKLNEIITSTSKKEIEDVNSLVSLLGIKSAALGESKEISPESKLILNSLGEIEKRISSMEDLAEKVQRPRFVVPPPPPRETTKFYGIGLNETIPPPPGLDINSNE
ncbi:hypothetical protein [Pontimicrobium sp. SW4]|uniref:Nucleoside 2-deoxyribosyltransferase n=1 Tax=Pontimicrobium sp. SW4 TaxID=3153519 RepID=A0AAU7BP24_9FLAO